MWRYLLIGLSVAATMALAMWLRLGWIESADTAHRCLAGYGGVGCLARRLALAALHADAWRIMALAGAVLALAWKHPFSAWLAAWAGGIALVLYGPEAGAAALLVGSLRLVRLAAASGAQPRGEDRSGEQGVAQQP